ncbi:hypothetical protein [Stenotrophomonas sp.]|uniref:hypothetical protein n=1 Tax=Stenotrophomonas sp. TaxID=69392 RepID=UPI0028998F38|nr:hypothetical protein [Stenotrophomonas sp.]
MRSKKKIVAGALALVSAVCIGYYHSELRNRPAPPELEAKASNKERVRAAMPHFQQTNMTKLPSIETPLNLIILELIRRADSGDSMAACRLAAEYQRCDFVDRQIKHLDDVTGSGALEGKLTSVTLTSENGQLYGGVQHCQGVQPSAPSRIPELLRRAALGGNPAAMRAYVSGSGFSTDTTLEDLDELDAYKKLAPEMARRSIESGDGAVLLSLASAYQPENNLGARPLLAQVVSTDITQSLSLFSVAKQEMVNQGRGEGRLFDFVDRQVSNLEFRASASQRAEAERRAQQLQTTMKQVRFPPDSDVAFISRASTRAIRSADCSE